MDLTITSFAGLQIGDVVTWRVRLTAWQRLLVWLAMPMRWPPTHHTAEAVICATLSSTQVEVEWHRETD